MKEECICKENGYYTAKQTAEILGVHLSTVSRWARNGKIRYQVRRLTNTMIFKGADIMTAWRSVY